MTWHLRNRRLIAGTIVFCIVALASVILAPSLPEQMTTHWNGAGMPDGTTPKSMVLIGGPALVLALVVFFEVIPHIDPLGENVASFRDAYDMIATLVVAFIAYAYGFVLAWNLGYHIAVELALVPAIAVLFVAIGFLLERAERNWFVGVRTPWTLSSDEVWRDTHDRVSTLFKLAGIVVLGGLVFPGSFVYFIVVPAVVISIFAMIYSYVDYRRVEERG